MSEDIRKELDVNADGVSGHKNKWYEHDEILCLNKYHAMKTYFVLLGRVEEYFHAFLTSAVNGVQWSIPREISTRSRWIGGWVGVV
jgi:hypothetical protein